MGPTLSQILTKNKTFPWNKTWLAHTWDLWGYFCDRS